MFNSIVQFFSPSRKPTVEENNEKLKETLNEDLFNSETDINERLVKEHNKIVNDCQLKVNEMKELLLLAKGTQYFETLEKIYLKIIELHNKIIYKHQNENMPIIKLQQLYNWRVNPFIDMLNKVLSPLKPKKEVDESMLAESKVAIEKYSKPKEKTELEKKLFVIEDYLLRNDITENESANLHFKKMVYNTVLFIINEEKKLDLVLDKSYFRFIDQFNHKQRENLGIKHFTYVEKVGDKSLYLDYKTLEVFYFNKSKKRKEVVMTIEIESIRTYFELLN